MANSIQYAKIVKLFLLEKVDTNELGGRVRVAFAEYEAATEQSTISLCLQYLMVLDYYLV